MKFILKCTNCYKLELLRMEEIQVDLSFLVGLVKWTKQQCMAKANSKLPKAIRLIEIFIIYSGWSIEYLSSEVD